MGPPPGPGATTSVPDVLAAIDIGTNSIHMVVARVAGQDRFEVITRLKEMVRLGSGQGEMKHLEPDAIDRGVAALKRCRSLADSLEAQVFAVATSAVREALQRLRVHRARPHGGRRRRQRHLRLRGGPAHPSGRHPGAPGLRQGRGAHRRRWRLHRGRVRAWRGRRLRTVHQVGIAPHDPPVLPGRRRARRRGRAVPPVRPGALGPHGARGRAAALRRRGGVVGDRRGAGRHGGGSRAWRRPADHERRDAVTSPARHESSPTWRRPPPPRTAATSPASMRLAPTSCSVARSSWSRCAMPSTSRSS